MVVFLKVPNQSYLFEFLISVFSIIFVAYEKQLRDHYKISILTLRHFYLQSSLSNSQRGFAVHIHSSIIILLELEIIYDDYVFNFFFHCISQTL